MLNKLTEALMQEDDNLAKQQSFTDAVVVSENSPMYKKLSIIDPNDQLTDSEKDELVEQLTSVDIDNDAPLEEQQKAVISACK